MKKFLETTFYALLATALLGLTSCETGGSKDNNKGLMLLALLGLSTAPAAPAVPDTPVPPSVPGSATVTPADDQLTLSWTGVEGAAAYEVWYNTADDTSSAQQSGGDIAETTYVMTGLANGTTYYVWLRAKNAAGVSGFGPGASGTPDFNVAAVSGLAASTAVNTITLTWSDPEADEFDRVEIIWSPDGSTAQTVSAGTRTFQIAAHADGTPYAITLRSVYADGRYFDATVTTTGEVPVATADELNNVRNDLTAHYILTADIDLSGYAAGEGWVPVGTDTDQFTGSLNGNGHTIGNLTINRTTAACQGLFGYIGTEGSVRDLGITGGSVKGQMCVGGLAGYNYGALSNCYSTGTVTGISGVGGLVGANSGQLSNCFAAGAVSGAYNSTFIGGLFGSNDGGVMNCYATGNVSVGANSMIIGGLAGGILGGSLTNSYSTGIVTAGADSFVIGGLVGVVASGVSVAIEHCYYYQAPNNSIGTQLTEAQMKDLNNYVTNYAGFDFTDVWGIDGSINNGFPYLRSSVP